WQQWGLVPRPASRHCVGTAGCWGHLFVLPAGPALHSILGLGGRAGAGLQPFAPMDRGKGKKAELGGGHFSGHHWIARRGPCYLVWAKVDGASHLGSTIHPKTNRGRQMAHYGRQTFARSSLSPFASAAGKFAGKRLHRYKLAENPHLQADQGISHCGSSGLPDFVFLVLFSAGSPSSAQGHSGDLAFDRKRGRHSI